MQQAQLESLWNNLGPQEKAYFEGKSALEKAAWAEWKASNEGGTEGPVAVAKTPAPPRKPRTPWMLFCADEYAAAVAQLGPGATDVAVKQRLALMWDALPNIRMAEYEGRADEEDAGYKAQMAAFEAEQQGGVGARPSLEPKKPLSAWVHFSSERRAIFNARNPGVGARDVGQMVSRYWKSMGATERTRFERKAEEDARRYGREMDLWERKNPGLKLLQQHEKRRAAVQKADARGASHGKGPKAATKGKNDQGFVSMPLVTHARGMFAPDLPQLMYAFGDSRRVLPESVAAVEDVAAELIANFTKRALIRAGRRGTRVHLDDLMTQFRRNPRQLSRAKELLRVKEAVRKARASQMDSGEGGATTGRGTHRQPTDDDSRVSLDSGPASIAGSSDDNSDGAGPGTEGGPAPGSVMLSGDGSDGADLDPPGDGPLDMEVDE